MGYFFIMLLDKLYCIGFIIYFLYLVLFYNEKYSKALVFWENDRCLLFN